MATRIGPRRAVPVYLARWRDYFGLSQEALGLRFDPPVSKGTISKIESKANRAGALTRDVIAAYAEALGRPAVDMYRLPPPKGQKLHERPSLDELAADLPDDLHSTVVSVIEAIKMRRAS